MRRFVLLTMLMLSHCDSGGSINNQAGELCGNGQPTACTCANGSQGLTQCTAGSHYGECDCGQGAAGTGGIGATAGASGNSGDGGASGNSGVSGSGNGGSTAPLCENGGKVLVGPDPNVAPRDTEFCTEFHGSSSQAIGSTIVYDEMSPHLVEYNRTTEPWVVALVAAQGTAEPGINDISWMFLDVPYLSSDIPTDLGTLTPIGIKTQGPFLVTPSSSGGIALLWPAPQNEGGEFRIATSITPESISPVQTIPVDSAATPVGLATLNGKALTMFQPAGAQNGSHHLKLFAQGEVHTVPSFIGTVGCGESPLVGDVAKGPYGYYAAYATSAPCEPCNENAPGAANAIQIRIVQNQTIRDPVLTIKADAPISMIRLVSEPDDIGTWVVWQTIQTDQPGGLFAYYYRYDGGKEVGIVNLSNANEIAPKDSNTSFITVLATLTQTNPATPDSYLLRYLTPDATMPKMVSIGTPTGTIGDLSFYSRQGDTQLIVGTTKEGDSPSRLFLQYESCLTYE